MATDNEKISEAVQGALAHIKTNTPEEHSKLTANGKLKDAITTAAREAADEEVTLLERLRYSLYTKHRCVKYLLPTQLALQNSFLCYS